MSTISHRLETLTIPGPAGKLEALFIEGQPGARHSALICHPHPMGGGTMHNKVVYRAAKTMQSLGLPTLRFNFRGTGLSEGDHDEGRGEQDDVRAALDWLHHRNELPMLVVGFSFGAHVGLRVCCSDSRVPGFAALGLPVAAEGRHYRYSFLTSCALPKLFISGGSDEYGPTAELQQIVAAASEPKSLVIIPDADHFFVGKLEQMQNALREWLVTRYFPDLQQGAAQMR
jgi:hypothetical protein